MQSLDFLKNSSHPPPEDPGIRGFAMDYIGGSSEGVIYARINGLTSCSTGRRSIHSVSTFQDEPSRTRIPSGPMKEAIAPLE